MKKQTGIALAVTAVVAAAGLFASPYWTLHSIAKAVENKDAAAVAEHVDFPALREDLKGKLLLRMQGPLNQPEMANNPFAGVGQMLVAGMVNQMVEVCPPPAGAMLMLEKGHPSIKPQIGGPEDAGGDQKRPRFKVRYNGWSKVYVHPENQKGGFIFHRDGLLSWKLVAMDIPELDRQ